MQFLYFNSMMNNVMMSKKTFFLMGLLFWTASGNAQAVNPEHNYARNSPGIVMVQAVFSATVYVNKVDINERIFDKLVDSVKKLDTSGRLLSPAQKLDIVVKALYKSPLRFFSSTNEYFRQARRVQSNGTGFLITGDGYIVTNCHIIDRDSVYIRNKFILETFQEVTQANINALQTSWAMTLTEEQRNLLSNTYGLIYSQVSSMILFDLEKEFYVLYRTDTGVNGTETIRKKATVIIKGRAMPGKDVAILKAEEVTDLPTLVIANDSLIRIGAQALVIGYPEPVTSNSFLSAASGIEPTLTAGIVSAIKKSVNGWPVIQMDAVISHGSSGSPVCNDKGEVVALATFGSLDLGNGSLASGFNFAIPISVVREYIDSANIKPQASKATLAFNQGLGFFYQQFYRKAKEKFEEVKQLNPHYPQLGFYLQQCKNKIAGGIDRQPPPRKFVFWVMIGIAAMTAIYLVYKMRKQRGFS